MNEQTNKHKLLDHDFLSSICTI